MIVGNYETREVFIDGVLLDPAVSQRVKNHSPDGFAWGYGGSGPSQLSLAILIHFSNEEKALRLYRKFLYDVISKLPQTSFELDTNFVKDWVDQAWVDLMI